ncbi:hypothetical protein FQN52_000458 [Onygenales sp. PD_12]|nr:hypothetical protein FQN52_000458 [Onygenales sp. PD_12]
MRLYTLLGACVILVNSPTAVADITVAIDAGSDRGTWDGWGTSLAWWGKVFGDRDDLADIFFTLDTTQFNGVSLPGLGFSIVRYNVGACSWNSVEGQSMVVSSIILPFRQMEGYWIDSTSNDPTSSSWDWSVDSNQRQLLRNAIDRGANRTELFSNAPMWWMCKNNNPSGAEDGGENLQSSHLEDHAVYMAEVAKYFKDNWDVEFESVDPFNEPLANWWTANGKQEGCHFDIPTQATIIGYLNTHLQSRGLSTYISASDESLYDQAVTNLQSIGSDALSKVHRVNVHGYQQGGGRRDTLRSLATELGKVLWNSEYGDDDGSGKNLVSNLMLDFRWLLPTAWAYWQALDHDGWGLIDADVDIGSIVGVNQKYFVLAQFARHIRPGMRILDGGGDDVVAAYDAGNQKLVIVAVNWDAAQDLTFELSGFSQLPADASPVTRWQTQIPSGDQYVEYADTTVSGTQVRSYFESNTVQTFEVSGVQL